MASTAPAQKRGAQPAYKIQSENGNQPPHNQLAPASGENSGGIMAARIGISKISKRKLIIR